MSIFLKILLGAISLLKEGLHHERKYNQPKGVTKRKRIMRLSWHRPNQSKRIINKPSKWIYRQNWQQIICPQSQTGQVVDESDIVANLAVVTTTVQPVLCKKQ